MNQYRLGTIFLKNFYTGFDYNNDEILIGVNKGSYSAEIFGFSPNPKDITSTNSNYILIIVLILILFGGAILIYIK
jgi:hypothetical protein